MYKRDVRLYFADIDEAIAADCLGCRATRTSTAENRSGPAASSRL